MIKVSKIFLNFWIHHMSFQLGPPKHKTDLLNLQFSPEKNAAYRLQLQTKLLSTFNHWLSSQLRRFFPNFYQPWTRKTCLYAARSQWNVYKHVIKNKSDMELFKLVIIDTCLSRKFMRTKVASKSVEYSLIIVEACYYFELWTMAAVTVWSYFSGFTILTKII